MVANHLLDLVWQFPKRREHKGVLHGQFQFFLTGALTLRIQVYNTHFGSEVYEYYLP